MRKNLIVLTLLLNPVLYSNTLLAQDFKIKESIFEPRDSSIKVKQSAVSEYIGFYQKYISGIRGQECPMYPSCSYYGLKNFSETNFISAFVMTSDRLLRCGHDHNNYNLTLRSNGFKHLDYPAYTKFPNELIYKRNTYYFAHSDTLKDDLNILFIKKLINNQYYQEALLEIMRIEFNYNNFNIDLFINKIICLRALGEFEKALFEYESKCPIQFKANTDLVFQIALIHYKLQNFDLALKSNLIALESCRETFCKAKIHKLNGLIYANKNDWQNALLSYKSLYEYDSYKQLSITNSKLSEKGIQLKNKSPTFAATLSIIPGLGYAYSGHKQTAISAFLINGLLTYATYTNLKNKNYGMGILTGIFNLSFYAGNIYGAKKSAKRFNEQQKRDLINKMEFNLHF